MGKALRQDFMARSQQLYLDIWHKVWSRMIPYGSSMSQPSISQQRGYTDLRLGNPGLTNIEGVTVEEKLVWPSRAVGLLCWNALLWAVDLGCAKGRVDFLFWRGWPGKAKSLVNEIPTADLTPASPWGIWRKWPPESSPWIVSVGLLPSSFHCPPAWALPELVIPFTEVTSLSY